MSESSIVAQVLGQIKLMLSTFSMNTVSLEVCSGLTSFFLQRLHAVTLLRCRTVQGSQVLGPTRVTPPTRTPVNQDTSWKETPESHVEPTDNGARHRSVDVVSLLLMRILNG